MRHAADTHTSTSTTTSTSTCVTYNEKHTHKHIHISLRDIRHTSTRKHSTRTSTCTNTDIHKQASAHTYMCTIRREQASYTHTHPCTLSRKQHAHVCPCLYTNTQLPADAPVVLARATAGSVFKGNGPQSQVEAETGNGPCLTKKWGLP